MTLRPARILAVRLALRATCGVVSAKPGGHEAEVDALATIMAVTRTAGERCPGVTVDEAAIIAAKDRLHVVDADYFGFRRKAHARAETIEDELDLHDAIGPWCDATMARYGTEGMALPGALRR